MNRRTALQWMLAGVAGIFGVVAAAITALPSLWYCRAALAAKEKTGPVMRRVAALGDLPLNQPVEIPVIGQTLDAWEFLEKTLGRIWVTRLSDNPQNPKETKIQVFSSICPHEGCTILKDPAKAGFYCPCHAAYFTADGAVISPETSKSPRAMDTLEYEIVRDGTAESGTWWLAVAWERFEENIPEKISV